MNNIPFLDLKRLNEPYFDAVTSAVSRVISSGRYIGGPEVEEFECKLADYQQVEHAIGVSNGLDALRLILMGYIVTGRLKHGDEILVPANTYIASVLAISHAGLKPVLAEPSESTMNLDTGRLEQYITPKTRAVMIVHLYGHTCWDEVLIETARKHNLLIIEDNAQAIGSVATLPGLNGSVKAGSLGNAAAFSFYPTKNLGAQGDAGAVVTDDKELADAVRALANYGSDRRYHNVYKGFNCRMDPVQAAVLNVKFGGFEAENQRRRDIALLYSQSVSNPCIRICTVTPPSTTNYHQLVAVTQYRDAIREHLASQGIGTDIHYPVPPHLQPCYVNDCQGVSLPVATRLSRSILSLPIAPYLTDDEVMTVAHALNGFAI